MEPHVFEIMEVLIPIINRLQRGGHQYHPVASDCGGGNTEQWKELSTRKPSGERPASQWDWAGIVTQRPLILQLVHVSIEDKPKQQEKKKELNQKKGVNFFTQKNKLYKDVDEIWQEFENEIERISGNNKKVVLNQFILRFFFFSQHFKSYTYGFARNDRLPVGDQPKGIELLIRELILRFISNPNSIILSVTTVNTIMATSEHLKFQER